MNIAIVRGQLSSAPRLRTLASGSELVSYEVTTGPSDGPRLTVPVVWFDPVRAPRLDSGDEVVAVGVVRRRFFQTGGGVQSRTEVEASAVAKAASARASRALEAAARAVTDAA